MLNPRKIAKRALVSTAAASLLLVPSAANARVLAGDTSGGEANRELVAASYAAPGTSSGFQWGDAAIGAAGALGIASIAGVSGHRMRRRRLTAS